MKRVLVLTVAAGLLAACDGNGPPVGGAAWGGDVPEAVPLSEEDMNRPPPRAPQPAAPEAEAVETTDTEAGADAAPPLEVTITPAEPTVEPVTPAPPVTPPATAPPPAETAPAPSQPVG